MNTTTFRKSPLFRSIAFTVLVAFIGMLPAQPSYAQVAIVMPPPGQMIHVTSHFEPPQMVGLKIDLKDPFSFDFIMDQGERPMSDFDKKEEFNKIIKYFLVSLAMPNKEMWVNLSPYESNRIIPEVFAQTEMGRDLLAQDYILKQFTASLMYPEDGLGKKFWNKVYNQAQARFGTTNISVNTFNKVWIVADKADIYQKGDTAFLVNSHLKVMLEQDYMAIEKNKDQFGNVQAIKDDSKDARGQMASQIVREIIIPAIEKEVNDGKSFAAVRQVYNAEIMATWFKKTLRESLLGQVFANKSKIAGQKVSDPQAREKIYKEYLRAYKKGVFNYIKEDAAPDGQIIPRKYFSGGAQGVNEAMITTLTPEDVVSSPKAAAEVNGFVKRATGYLKEKGRIVVALVTLTLVTLGALNGAVLTTPATANNTVSTTPATTVPQEYVLGGGNDVSILRDQLKKTLDMVKGDRTAYSEALRDAQKKIEAAIKDKERAIKDTEDALRKLKAVTAENVKITAKNTEITAGNAEQLKAKQAALQKTKDYLSYFLGKLTEAQGQIRDLQVKLKAANAAKDVQVKINNDLTSGINSLNQRIASLNDQINWWIVGLGTTAVGLGVLSVIAFFTGKKKRKDLEAELADAEKKRARLTQELTQSIKDLEEANAKVATAEAAAAAAAAVDAVEETIVPPSTTAAPAEAIVRPAALAWRQPIASRIQDQLLRFPETYDNVKKAKDFLNEWKTGDPAFNDDDMTELKGLLGSLKIKYNENELVLNAAKDVAYILKFEYNKDFTLADLQNQLVGLKNQLVQQSQALEQGNVALKTAKAATEDRIAAPLGFNQNSIDKKAEVAALQAVQDEKQKNFDNLTTAVADLRNQTEELGAQIQKHIAEAPAGTPGSVINLANQLTGVQGQLDQQSLVLEKTKTELADATTATAARIAAPLGFNQNSIDKKAEVAALQAVQDEKQKNFDNLTAVVADLQSQKNTLEDKIEKNNRLLMNSHIDAVFESKQKALNELNKIRQSLETALLNASDPVKDHLTAEAINKAKGIGQKNLDKDAYYVFELRRQQSNFDHIQFFNKSTGTKGLEDQIAQIKAYNKGAAIDVIQEQIKAAQEQSVPTSDLQVKLAEEYVKFNNVAKIVQDNVGGINLSDEHLTINIKVDGAGMPLPAYFQDKALMNLNGLTSIIRRITPITPENVPALYELVK